MWDVTLSILVTTAVVATLGVVFIGAMAERAESQLRESIEGGIVTTASGREDVSLTAQRVWPRWLSIIMRTCQWTAFASWIATFAVLEVWQHPALFILGFVAAMAIYGGLTEMLIRMTWIAQLTTHLVGPTIDAVVESGDTFAAPSEPWTEELD